MEADMRRNLTLSRRIDHPSRILPILIGALLPGLAACHHCPVEPQRIAVNPGGNGVLEPNSQAAFEPTWLYHSVPSNSGCPQSSPCPPTASVDGTLSSFDGPTGSVVYDITDAAASYGTVPRGGSRSCAATGDCYGLKISMSGSRPAAHWDATVHETTSGAATPALDWITPAGLTALSPDACPVLYGSTTWTLHVGKSFADVPADGFYPSIENLFHHGITAGCDTNHYCPADPIRREQMAVFLLKSINGSAYVPPPCVGEFSDVPCPGLFADWIEDVHNRGIIADCGGANFCPKEFVERRDMAAWLLKAHDGATFVPPPATGMFDDVPAGDPDAPWIEELYRRQITAGCNADPLLYCPYRRNTRAQMAVFLVKTWGLRLY
jgi:S-layer homology domain